MVAPPAWRKIPHRSRVRRRDDLSSPEAALSPELGRLGFVLAALLVVGWFAIGTQLNVRRGHRLLGWLERGLPLVGEKTTLRWLGSSAVELKVAAARAPLRSAEVFIVLEPRDVPILWWLFRALGRRDLLIVRGELRAAPRRELEALDPGAWSTRGIAGAVRRQRWIECERAPGSALVTYAPGRSTAAGPVVALAQVPELKLVRLAVRTRAPQLEVHWHLGGLETLDAQRVFETVHRLAGEV